MVLERTGLFEVRTVDGTPHCGVGRSVRVHYAFQATCGAGSLDERGFLFDQVTVDGYFQRKKSCRISCERMAMRCLKDLRRMIRRENPICKIEHLVLTLSPAPHAASIRVEWRKK